jgi:hypothetical protein
VVDFDKINPLSPPYQGEAFKPPLIRGGLEGFVTNKFESNILKRGASDVSRPKIQSIRN